MSNDDSCCNICAEISTKTMFLMILKVQELLLQNNVDKKTIMSMLSSLEHDVLLINNENNRISRDLLN